MEPIIGKGQTKDSESLLDQMRGQSVIDDHLEYKTAKGEGTQFSRSKHALAQRGLHGGKKHKKKQKKKGKKTIYGKKKSSKKKHKKTHKKKKSKQKTLSLKLSDELSNSLSKLEKNILSLPKMIRKKRSINKKRNTRRRNFTRRR